MKQTLLIFIVGVAALGVATVYAVFDPLESGFFPRCMFHELTGLQCPGCGSQRALHAILNGDIPAAWHFNPLFILEIPLLALLGLTLLWPARFPRMARFLNSEGFILSLLAVILIFTVIKNL